MIFYTRPSRVEAFRLTYENRDHPEEWPGWMREAYAKVWNEVGAVSDMLGSRSLYVRDRIGAMLVCHLDWWIVRNDQSDLSVYDPETFAQRFVPSLRTVLEEAAQ
jgi:hypothetical protein